MRIAYKYEHLSDKAKKVAQSQSEGALLAQWLYNEDGTIFKNSTTIEL